MVVMGFYDDPSTSAVQLHQEKLQEFRRRREARIKSLRREIQVYLSRGREYAHLLAEIRLLQKDQADEFKEKLGR